MKVKIISPFWVKTTQIIELLIYPQNVFTKVGSIQILVLPLHVQKE